MNLPVIVIAGGSGFIGQHLAELLVRNDYRVVVLTRQEKAALDGIEYVQWDAVSRGAWMNKLSGSAGLVNLTGKSIQCRLTEQNRAQIIETRVASTSILATALNEIANPPPVFVQASAVGYYGDTGAECDENSPPACDTFLSQTCVEWEQALVKADIDSVRKVIIRIGVVLADDGGAFPVLRRLTKNFLGGSVGKGRQHISWIHIDDLGAIFLSSLRDGTMSGIYNAVSQSPATNSEFMATLRHVMRRPWSPPVPSIAVRLGCFLLGTNPDLVLTGQKVLPERLIDRGFEFKYTSLRDSFAKLMGESHA